MQTKNVIRNIYLYLVSAISLFMVVFSIVSLLNLALRTWVFPLADDNYAYPMAAPTPACVPDKNGVTTCPPVSADEQKKFDEQNQKAQDQNRRAQRQRDLVQNISMLLVALPLFGYHWMLIRKDRAAAQE